MLLAEALDLEASIAAVKDALLADERVSAAILFGSAAKGVARAASDLDLAPVARSARDAAGATPFLYRPLMR